MPTGLFSSRCPIASYEQEELLKQFTTLAEATGGQLDPQALRLSERMQTLISNLRWHNLTGNIHLRRSWATVVEIRLHLPKPVSGQVRLGNVYGETSGTPLMGAPRLESNWPTTSLSELFPPNRYWQLASAREPFMLLIQHNGISLNTYRFYQSDFYLAALTYLAGLAEQVMLLHPPLQQCSSRITQVQLPWMKEIP